MFAFDKPKNPYRKKGGDYDLSENSRLAAQDFAYSNKLAKRIYPVFKIIQARACSRSTYSNLSKRIYSAVRNDRSNDLGCLRIGYGSLAPLIGLRFSSNSSWQTFFINKPHIVFDTDSSSLMVCLPEIRSRDMKKKSSRISKIGIQLHLICIDVDREEHIKHIQSKLLLWSIDGDMPSRTAKFALNVSKDKVLLLVAAVNCWLFDPSGIDEFKSNDARYIAAECLAALLIKDGKLQVFNDQESPVQCHPHDFDGSDDVDWD